MISIFDLDADVQLGDLDQLPDWRKEHDLMDEDPDDEELDQTPEDVIAILGFDPKELKD